MTSALKLKLLVNLVIAFALALALVVPAAHAAEPVKFATTTGSCASSDYTASSFSSGTQSAAHSGVLVRVSIAGNASGWIDQGSDQSQFGPQDVVWFDGGSVSAGQSATGSVQCSTGATGYTVDFFDVPGAPSVFSGSGTNGSNSHSQSTVDFVVPSRAIYTADLSLSSGTVTLRGPWFGTTNPQTFASSGSYDLGSLTAGVHSLTVVAGDGPQARWSLTIHAQPVVVSAVAFDVAAAPGGAVETLSYAVSGDTTLSASITAPSGAVVRTLASPFGATAGAHTLTWDGRDGSGTALPDGVYTATVNSTDPNGNTSSGVAQITLDSNAPSIAFSSPTTLTPKQALTFTAADAGAGVKSVDVAIDDGGGSTQTSGQQSYSIVPYGGWKVGSHRVAVTATDVLGNTATKTQTVTVVANLPTASGPKRTTYFIDELGRPHLRPRSIRTGSAEVLKSLHWSRWGGLTAIAKGVAYGNTCRPNCARGKFRSEGTVHVTLLSKGTCKGRTVYRRALINYYRLGKRYFRGTYRATCH